MKIKWSIRIIYLWVCRVLDRNVCGTRVVQGTSWWYSRVRRILHGQAAIEKISTWKNELWIREITIRKSSCGSSYSTLTTNISSSLSCLKIQFVCIFKRSNKNVFKIAIKSLLFSLKIYYKLYVGNFQKVGKN